jgi:hypothetical protein
MSRSFPSRFALTAVIAAIASPASVFAQSAQGSIQGTVTDKTGAVVPGVNLVATNTATNTRFTATTNSTGLYVFAVLPVGNYTITASREGFARVEEQNVEVSVGSKLTFDVALTVGTSGESVSVSAEAPAVEITRSSQSSTVNETSIENLPVNGRNFIDFTLLTPGVNRDVRGGDLSFAGQRGTLNSLTIDGTDNNNTFFGQTLGRTGSGRAPYQFSEDSVQEFQVNTNSYSAEYGRAGGAVINVVTKSGTNQFHGSAFEFFRDRALNANDPIYDLQLVNARNNKKALPIKPGYHFNQFGGTFGGPVKKDKLFFFFDYDGQRNNTGNAILQTLPAATNAFEAAAVQYLQPRLANYNKTFNQDVFLGKVDYVIDNANILTARYNAQRFTGLAQENSGSFSALEHTGASNVATDTLSVQLTSTVSSTFTNVAKLSFQRDHEPGEANSLNPEARITIGTNFFVGRNSFSPRETTLHRQEFGDTITQLVGRHTLKYGVDFLRDGILNYFPGNFSGAYIFTSLSDFGMSLLGVPVPTANGSTYTQNFAGPNTTGATTHPDLFQSGGFIQDDFRVSKSLTLNLGVRYDLVKAQNANAQNPAALAQGINTMTIPTDTNNFAPRLGFAWSPFSGSHPTVIRGGWGMFYGNTPSIMYGTALSGNGINVVSYTYGKNVKFLPTQNYATTLCGPAVSSPSCAAPAGAANTPSLFVFSPKFQQPYVEQYNLGIEREMANGLSLSVSYLGVQGHHIQRTNDINLLSTFTQVPYTVAGTGQVLTVNAYPATRPYSGFGRILQFQSNSSSNYNALVFSASKRFSKNFQMMASYTWSKVIDDNPDATAVVVGADDGKEASYPTNLKLDRGIGNNNVPHRLITSAVWNLDGYTQGIQNGFTKRLVGGWALSGIFNAQTGQPYSAKISADLNLDGNSSTDRVPGYGRNTFRLPNIYTFDPRITKTVAITEKTNLQLIAEGFNIFNHANVTGVNTAMYKVTGTTLTPQTVQSVGIGAFGVPTSANLNGNGNVGRVLQLAAKFNF